MDSSNKIKNEDLVAEFHEFMSSRPQEVPSDLSAKIISRVHSELNPSKGRVLLKTAGVHVLVASLSLLFCPQLGIGPFGGGRGLLALFHRLGPNWCAMVCGAMFLGFSSFIAAWLLTREELLVANVNGYAYAVLFTALSFASLMLLGAEGNLDVFLFWNLGALIAGVSGLRLGAFTRCRLWGGVLAKVR